RADEFDADERLGSIGRRTEHIHALYRMVAGIIATRTSAQWIALLEAADIPVMPMHTVETLLEDPHLQAVGFFDYQEHPSEGRIRTLGIPSTWSATQPSLTRPAPQLGEHSAQILAAAGYTPEDIDTLAAKGITRL
ncbi:MAG: CoA transferase, partial [Pseudomonas sp.]